MNEPLRDGFDEYMDNLPRWVRSRLVSTMQELAKRKQEALALYRPLPHALPFHMSLAYERILTGGQQSSKTTTACAEFVAALANKTLHGPAGGAIPNKFDRNRPWLFWVFGLGEKHLGGTIYRKLFLPGSFDLIKDKHTDEWRSWNPTNPDDADREDECVPAPPLIPQRLIAQTAWTNKASNVLEVLKTTMGDEVRFYTSGGDCPTGVAPNVIWIDENLGGDGSQIAELRMRLGRSKGRFWWSAWPDFRNDALHQLVQRAKAEANLPSPSIVHFTLTYSGNPFIAEDQKKRILAGMSERERAARDSGQFLQDTVRVFPAFDVEVHGLPGTTIKDNCHRLLQANAWRVPDNWTKYLVVDPGHQHPFAIGLAVSPPDEGDYVVQFMEVAINNISAREMAREIKRRANVVWEEWIIDDHGSRKTPEGMAKGQTIRAHYRNEFIAEGLTNNRGNAFTLGCDDIAYRNTLVRDEWLEIRRDGTPRFRILNEHCPVTIEQAKSYSKRVSRESISESTIERDNDAMACWGYAAARRPKYVERECRVHLQDPRWLAFKKLIAEPSPEYGFRMNLDPVVSS